MSCVELTGFEPTDWVSQYATSSLPKKRSTRPEQGKGLLPLTRDAAVERAT